MSPEYYNTTIQQFVSWKFRRMMSLHQKSSSLLCVSCMLVLRHSQSLFQQVFVFLQLYLLTGVTCMMVFGTGLLVIAATVIIVLK